MLRLAVDDARVTMQISNGTVDLTFVNLGAEAVLGSRGAGRQSRLIVLRRCTSWQKYVRKTAGAHSHLLLIRLIF
jgi:hypothetical protein